jgi:hypothetical protein
MERLFSPCTRYRDRAASRRRLEEARGNGLEEHSELTKKWRELQELNLDVSTEELLRAERAFKYADLYAMLGNKNTVLWLTPHATVARGEYGAGFFYSLYLRDFYTFLLRVDSKSIHVFAHSLEAFQRLLMLSVVYCWLM